MCEFRQQVFGHGRIHYRCSYLPPAALGRKRRFKFSHLLILKLAPHISGAQAARVHLRWECEDGSYVYDTKGGLKKGSSPGSAAALPTNAMAVTMGGMRVEASVAMDVISSIDVGDLFAAKAAKLQSQTQGL